MRLNPFFRCKCGKVHIVTHIGPRSVCKCGLELWRQVYPVKV